MAIDWPTFEASLLQCIAEAFRVRRKAIAYHDGIICHREFCESGSGTYERLNVETGGLRISVWSDGVMWLNVCVRAMGRNAGWVFKDTFHGDIQGVLVKELVEMVETTLALQLGADTEQQTLRAVWARVHPFQE